MTANDQFIIKDLEDLLLIKRLQGELNVEIRLGKQYPISIYDTICALTGLRGSPEEVRQNLTNIIARESQALHHLPPSEAVKQEGYYEDLSDEYIWDDAQAAGIASPLISLPQDRVATKATSPTDKPEEKTNAESAPRTKL